MLNKINRHEPTTFAVTCKAARQLAAIAKGCDAKKAPALGLVEVTYRIAYQIEASGDHKIMAVGTDSYVLLTRTVDAIVNADTKVAEGTFLVDGKEWATALTTAAKVKFADSVTIAIGDDMVTISYKDVFQSSIRFSDQRYADWRKLVDFDRCADPAPTEVTHIGFNPTYMTRVMQGQSTLASDYKGAMIRFVPAISISVLKHTAALQATGWVTDDGYAAALMPVRIREE